MNPEIQSIVDDMQKRCPKNPLANSDVQTYLLVQASRLHVLIAKESEIQSRKISKLTKTMVWLTVAIVILTLALLFVGIVQIIMILN